MLRARSNQGRPRISMKMMTAILIALVLGVFWWAFQQNARPFWQQSDRLMPSSTEHSAPSDEQSFTNLSILVHVSGAVQQPGVYQLPTDARVVDLVQRAGGFSTDADPAGVNLARLLHDAEHVSIPSIGEQQTQLSATPGLININTADLQTLDTLPRIGPSLATRIIQYRERHGPFRDLAGLLAVSGIGPSVIEDIRDKITF